MAFAGTLGCDEGGLAEPASGSGGAYAVAGGGGSATGGAATTGGATATGGATTGGRATATGGAPATGGATWQASYPVEELGTGQMQGSGTSSERYAKSDVSRDGVNYFFMANGWGPKFESQSVSWNGTAFTVKSMQGTMGEDYSPASYPTVFCGAYSDSQSKSCGLPAAISSLTTLRTGWSWRPNGNTGEYNAAYDIWLANGPDRGSFSGYLMVWFRDPVGQQPAGSVKARDVVVANVPGVWDIWAGTVWDGFPIINWVRREEQDTLDMEFDVMDFIRDAQRRGYEVPGTHVLSVAVGFEIWEGPVNNLETVDFFVDVH
jgi:hypothetical protein